MKKSNLSSSLRERLMVIVLLKEMNYDGECGGAQWKPLSKI